MLISCGSDNMITNQINRIDKKIIEVPLIIRDDYEGWVPTFDIWPTTIDEETSYIDSTQSFGAKLKHYKTTKIDPRIGYFENDNLVIYWKTLINSEDLEKVNSTFNGKLRGTCWKKRYCTYFTTDSSMPWLHSVIVGCDSPDKVVHHIDGVSLDNRRKNLHILPKREHDSINHPGLDVRKLMFANPEEYWKIRRQIAVNEFIRQLALIFTFEGQASFIAKFAKENEQLVKEILEAARFDMNLSSLQYMDSENRRLNSHLRPEYLDAYEIEKYLKKCAPKQNSSGEQIRLF
jgi:hypothetical protein